MRVLEKLYGSLAELLPLLATLALVATALWLAHWLLLRRRADLGSEGKTPRQIAMLLLTIAGIVLVLLAVPMQAATRGQLLSLIGVALTAVIALSSTTFVANAMAGLMLRVVKSFGPGDFVRVGEHFGRVTERGLFHTEIQTEDRDLTTIPNLYLVSNPLTAVRASGTIVSARLSLGYDVSHATVTPLLVEAAKAAQLQDPFVHIIELGDFSVTYRVAGFLAQTRHLLTARSKLRQMVLDTLHAAGIEIVSPAFMNQRVLQTGRSVRPKGTGSLPDRPAKDALQTPEELIFDKADEAAKIERLRARRSALLAEIKELETQVAAADKDQRTRLEQALQRREAHAAALESELSKAEEKKAKRNRAPS